MKRFITFVVLCLTSFVFAQNSPKENTTSHFVINAGYDYWNGNFGRVGADLYLFREYRNILTFSANADLGYMRDKFRIIPEVGVGYLFNFRENHGDPYSSFVNAPFYVVRADISPWTVTPKIGLAILGLIELNAGYAFEFNENKNFKSMDGVRAGLTFHIPTVIF